MKILIRSISILLLVFVNIGCDQYSKAVVRENVSSYSITELMGDKLILTKVENSGAMLSLGENLSPLLKNILLQGLPSLALLVCLGILLIKTRMGWLSILALTAIVGGGIGNIYDRILYGSVTDFLQIDLGLLKSGVFNMADVSITVGIFLLLFQNFFGSSD